jgi:hypothetical protein
MQQTLQSIRDCLENSDWATRKAAADTLCVLATHSGHLIGDGTAPTIAALEACRFDKVTILKSKCVTIHRSLADNHNFACMLSSYCGNSFLSICFPGKACQGQHD